MTNTHISALALCLSLGLMPYSVSQLDGCDSDADEDLDGYTVGDGDCDDLDPSVYPAAPELCDGLDNDCDRAVDEEPTQMVYPDADLDGYGAATGGIQACPAPSGYVIFNTDCNDQDSSVHPGAPEVCDGTDVSCSGPAKEERNVLMFRDADGDGYGDPLHPILLRPCDATTGYVSQGADCDDAVSTIRPNSVESCNGEDDNCDGQSDEGLSLTYVDSDGDGFGTDSSASCISGSNRVSAHGDCDDGESSTHPGAMDSSSDSVDADCGGTTAQEVHVGYSSSPTLTLQQALEQASSNTTIWVNAGTYDVVDLNFNGKSVSLRGSHGPEQTTLDAKGTARAVIFNHAETSASRLEGFRIVNGKADVGGAVLIDTASPILENCSVESSTAIQGGGIALKNSTALLRKVTVRQNRANLACVQTEDQWYNQTEYWDFSCEVDSGQGAGVYVSGGAPALEEVRLESNTIAQSCGNSGFYDHDPSYLHGANSAECFKGSGGGLWAEDSLIVANKLVVIKNSAGLGGGVGTRRGSLKLTDSSFGQNTGSAEYVQFTESSHNYPSDSLTYTNGHGGGLYALETAVTLLGATFVGNTSQGKGGGAALFACTLQGAGLLASANTSVGRVDTQLIHGATRRTFHDGDGGGLALINTSASLETVALLGNSARRGSGLYGEASSSSTPLLLSHGKVAGNVGPATLDVSVGCDGCAELYVAKPGIGAGVYVSVPGSHLSYLDFSDNVARGTGALQNVTTLPATFAGGQGSAAYLSGASLSFSTLTRNTAAVGCVDAAGGLDACDIGKGTVMSVGGSLSHVILGYNEGSNLKSSGSVDLQYSDLYQAARCLMTSTGTQCDVNYDLASLPSSNLEVTPGFASLDSSGRPIDSHLGSSSPLVGKGSSTLTDPDGSTCDIGVFSGPDADQLDADLDGTPGWYWTSSYASAPPGVNTELFDADDLNSNVK